ncbi:hypothetical protein QVD17_09423 [Tagetes erecta]|uniref:Uncharacterized protein n=1 Tax=Tagetes erecta TaxID=13708 RepID=A0AAD8P5A6_TARER|nr:hypothetical protein QVD17_09423 [Tagetes erecta]
MIDFWFLYLAVDFFQEIYFRVFNALANAGSFEQTERIPKWLKDYIQEREIVFADDDPNASGSGSNAPDENSVSLIVEDKKPVLPPAGFSLTHADFAKKRSV